jgi:hypothetical protein
MVDERTLGRLRSSRLSKGAPARRHLFASHNPCHASALFLTLCLDSDVDDELRAEVPCPPLADG